MVQVRSHLRQFRNLLANRLYVSRRSERDIVVDFHKLFWHSAMFGKSHGETSFLGVPTLKCPLDLWVYQEILFETRPDVIIETGTLAGGSALFLASICDFMGAGKIISVDIQERENRPDHERISYLTGSSISDDVHERLNQMIRPGERVTVILDSDHHRDHVIKELRKFGPLVAPGNYLIVEDSNMGGHPVAPELGPGPMEAIHEFLSERDDFEIDRSREKYYLTYNPSGYLRRVR